MTGEQRMDDGEGQSLHLTSASSTAPLYDAIGSPVWPCADEMDVARLRCIAGLFGGSVVQADAGPSGTARASDASVVVALGQAAESLACLYAHLTRRRFRLADSPVEAVETQDVVVVVHLGPALPYALLDEIQLRRLNARVGVLWAANHDELRRQILVRSAALRLSPRAERRSVLFSPILGRIEPLRLGRLELRGSAETSDEVEAMADSAVLAVTTHSDGLDAMFGRNLSFCGLRSRPAPMHGPDLRPRCVVTEVCHRQSLPLQDAMLSDRLIDAHRLGARVLVWNTCFGVMTQVESVADAWGLLPRLLDSPRIGCLIVLRAIVTTGTATVAPLVANLHAGSPVGVAMESWRHDLVGSTSEMVGERMFIFGDPEVVANPAIEEPALLTMAADTAAAELFPGQRFAEGGLIRRFLADIDPSAPDEVDVVTRAREALDSYELELARPALLSYEAHASTLRSALLAAMRLRHWSLWSDSWQVGVRSTEVLAGRRCVCCAGPAFAAIYQPAPPASAPRYYANCGRCGAVDDRPAIDEAVVIFDPAGLRLRSGGPVADWTGAIWTLPSTPPSGWGEWPSEPPGYPAEVCPSPETTTVGPTFRVAIFITGWRLSLFMRRAYLHPPVKRE